MTILKGENHNESDKEISFCLYVSLYGTASCLGNTRGRNILMSQYNRVNINQFMVWNDEVLGL